MTLWVVCASHMKWIDEIWTELQSRHGKNFERLVWPWPLTFHPEKWCATHSPLVCCMYATYEVIRPNRDEATEWPQQKLLITGVTFISNDRCDLDLLDLEMDRDTSTCHCPASRTTLVATRFRVAVICPIIQVPHCIRVFFYFVWFVFINHIFQFYYELCTYCNILDIYLS